MNPGSFTDFFLASAGAAAALVGLLFVAVSIAPEQPFVPGAPPERRAVATAAFTALANAFFVSLGALIPGSGLGWFALIVGASSSLSTLSLGASIVRQRGARLSELLRPLSLVLVSLVIYGWEIYAGRLLLRNETDLDAIFAVAYLMLASHAVGLGRAWELLGAPRRGLLAWLSPLYELHRTQPAGDDREDGSPMGAPSKKPSERAT